MLAKSFEKKRKWYVSTWWEFSGYYRMFCTSATTHWESCSSWTEARITSLLATGPILIPEYWKTTRETDSSNHAFYWPQLSVGLSQQALSSLNRVFDSLKSVNVKHFTDPWELKHFGRMVWTETNRDLGRLQEFEQRLERAESGSLDVNAPVLKLDWTQDLHELLLDFVLADLDLVRLVGDEQVQPYTGATAQINSRDFRRIRWGALV